MSETSAISVSSSGKTGGTCQASGPYKCTTHTSTVIFFKRGQTFTVCPNATSSKGHATTWSVVTAR